MWWQRPIAILAWFWIVGVSPNEAAERKVGGRNVQYYTKAEIKELDGVEGHVIGTYESNGVTIHDNGELSTHTAKGSFGHVNGDGTQQGHIYRTFKDGSATVVRYQGRARRTGDGRVGDGTFRCVKGSGRFTGIQCHGTHHSIHLDNDMTVSDWQGTAFLPDAQAERQ